MKCKMPDCENERSKPKKTGRPPSYCDVCRPPEERAKDNAQAKASYRRVRAYRQAQQRAQQPCPDVPCTCGRDYLTLPL